MADINNYEQYCKAFRKGKKDSIKAKAELLLFIQDWIINVIDSIEEDTMDYSLKKLLAENSDKSRRKGASKDVLSSIIDDTQLAFRHLSDNLREKLVRENVQMPVYKVKEINSYGLNWLSRQSGRTIKQKISSAGNSVMAVQRKMSLDTAENRLFTAFVKELYEQLVVKVENYDEKNISSEEIDFSRELASFMFRDDIKEIKRWDNLPPNNTLLTDQNYKKIWHGWNELKKIDNKIQDDSLYVDERLSSIFFFELLTQLRNVVMIPQEPVEVEYDTYNVFMISQKINCMDANGNILVLWRDKDSIYAETYFGNIQACFENMQLSISVNEEESLDYKISPENFYKCVQLFITKLRVGTDKKRGYIQAKKKKKYKKIIIDLFALHPQYLTEEGCIKKMEERILQQCFRAEDIDGDIRDYYISCEKTNAIKMIHGLTETYTIPFAVDNGSMEQMKRLMHMMESYISTDSLTYVFPDAYNEFQLSMVHKTSRMAFRNVTNVPYSIGAVFNYQKTKEFQENFHPGEFILLVNLLDDELTFTLVSGVYDEKLEKDIPEYKGIVWERHPTSTVFCKNAINEKIVDKLIKRGCNKAAKIYKLLGIDGLKDEINSLSFYFGDDDWYVLKSEIEKIVSEFKMNIVDQITDFLLKNKAVVKNKNIHILSLIEGLVYNGKYSYANISKEDIFYGCNELFELQTRTELPLWHDHLPALAIKLMYGKFDLIKNATVVPCFNKKQKIEIPNTFTLPKECAEYHFNLVQDDNARKMQYEAVIRNPAFPLSESVECKLLMSYQYGAENPYELIFVPINTNNAGFVEAKINWEKLEMYEYMGLERPDFPEPLSWDELANYEGKSNLLDNLRKGFEQISDGYIYYDFSNEEQNNSKNGKIELNINGEDCIVRWNEKSWDKRFTPPSIMGKVSFLIVEDMHKKKTVRYRIENLREHNNGGNLWFKNRLGSYQCICNIMYEGRLEKVALYDSEFSSQSPFELGVDDVSFEIFENKKTGRLKAVNIWNENRTPYVERKAYYAKGMRAGDYPPYEFASSWFNFALYKTFSFSNNRSLSEKECPKDLQRIFVKAVKNWVEIYKEMKDPILSRRILLGMSLMARDIGKPYYELAYDTIDLYIEGKIKMADEVGCGLGDLTNPMEQRVFQHMLDLLPKDKMMFVLSKALWHNKQLVYNVDPEILFKYMKSAKSQLKRCVERYGNSGKYLQTKLLNDMSVCLEYILAVFRLRTLNDELINRKYLSLNNSTVKKIYELLELIVRMELDVKSFLKLEISSKGIYDFIPDLVYVLMIYITGNNPEGEIKISGLNIEEN